MTYKQCKYCKKVKPLTDFHKVSKARSHMGDGHVAKCKECVKKYMQSPERRKAALENQRKRRMTPEGRQKHRDENSRYLKTIKGKKMAKKTRKRYANTAKGREKLRERSRRYSKTISYKKAVQKYRRLNPHKRKAQSMITSRIANGKIIRPSQCSVCNKHCTPEAHHPDYSKPLKIIWLCHECHVSIHWTLR